MLNEIPVIFHSGSSSDFYLIIKKLANEFEEQFQCLGKKTKYYKNFSTSIEKEVTKIDKEGNENIKTIPYKVKLIESARFMASSLSNPVENLT